MSLSWLKTGFCLLVTGAVAWAAPISPELGHANFRELTVESLPEGALIEQISQLPDGRMIWGTRRALLLHDGHEVETIPLPEDAGYLTGISSTADGRILISCTNYAGVATWDPRHGWRLEGWSPARSAITSFRHDFQLIERDGVLFALNLNAGAWFDGERWHAWPHFDQGEPDSAASNAYWSSGRAVYRLTEGRRLDRWMDGAWRRDRTLSADAPAFVRQPYENESGVLHFIDLEGELVRFAADGTLIVTPYATPDSLGAIDGAWFSHGAAVVRSQDASIHIKDTTGGMAARIDRRQGVPLGDVRTLFVDSSDRVWISLGESVACIDLPEHLTRFDRGNGLESGDVLALVRHGGRLYAGTSGGVYELIPGEPDDARSPARFNRVPGIASRTPALLVHDNQLLAGHAEGVSLLGPEGFTPICRTDAPVATLAASPFDPTRIHLGTAAGARSLRRLATGWETGGNDSFRNDIQAILEFAPNAWLIRSGSRDLRRFEQPFSSPREPAPTTNAPLAFAALRLPLFDESYIPKPQPLSGNQGAPLRAISLTRWGDTPVIVTEEGLFSTEDPPRALDLLDPETRRMLRGERRLQLFSPVSADRAWIAAQPTRYAARQHLATQLREVTRNASSPARILPAGAATVGIINALLSERAPDGENILWVGGERGLLRVRLDGLPAAVAPSVPRLHTTPALLEDNINALTVPPGQEQIALHFASPENIRSPLVYRSRLRLDGVGDWTPHQTGARRELDFPGPGDYVFEVQARSPDGLDGPIATLRFTVPPPWWLHPWTLAAGVLVLAGVFIISIQARSAQLRRDQRKLEAVVQARTAELRANEHQLRLAKTQADAARAQAEQANRAKSTFLAAMSHELRTPLNAILGFAQLLRREDGLTGRGQDQLAVIDRNGRHLLEMINEVLDLSKIEAGKLQLHVAPFSPRSMASGLAETFQLQASQRGLDFRLELDAGVPARVTGDEAKLRQVLINLLANALEHTPSGEVVLALGRRGDRVRFSVRDTGKGIPAADLEAIFEPFQQARAHRPDAGAGTRGSGLGLPISRRLVGLMGGVIEVESTVGRGSCFHFELPLPTAATTADSAPPFRIVGHHGPRRRILVVDDIETNRAVLRELLTLLGFEVREAATGEAALAAQRGHPADLVLLDLHLPDLDGREVARRLRESTPRPRLIAISASVLDLGPSSAGEAGCDDFVPKPIEETRLLDAIATQLKLDWISSPAKPNDPARSGPPPPPLSADEILALERPARPRLVEWLELARRADLGTLRARLAAEPPTAPGADFRRELDRLAARFRTGPLRDILAAALGSSPRDPS